MKYVTIYLVLCIKYVKKGTKSMRKVIVILLAMALATGSLASCGDKKSNQDTTQSSVRSSSEKTNSEQQKKDQTEKVDISKYINETKIQRESFSKYRKDPESDWDKERAENAAMDKQISGHIVSMTPFNKSVKKDPAEMTEYAILLDNGDIYSVGHSGAILLFKGTDLKTFNDAKFIGLPPDLDSNNLIQYAIITKDKILVSTEDSDDYENSKGKYKELNVQNSSLLGDDALNLHINECIKDKEQTKRCIPITKVEDGQIQLYIVNLDDFS